MHDTLDLYVFPQNMLQYFKIQNINLYTLPPDNILRFFNNIYISGS